MVDTLHDMCMFVYTSMHLSYAKSAMYKAYILVYTSMY